MSASNTAHVPMDEPHLSRYGANAARALELEGAVRPGTVAREMRRALAEVERARQELARWAEESGRTPGAVEWLRDNAYLAAREGRMAERAFRRGGPLRGIPERFLFVLSKRNPSDSKEKTGGQRPQVFALCASLSEAFQ